MPVLQRSLQSDLRPGSNVKGSAAGAAWTFLLPRLSFDHVLCWGAPSIAALETLSRLGRQVTVVLSAPAPDLEDHLRLRGATHVQLRTGAASPPPAPADLVFVTGKHADGDLSGPLEALTPGGQLYLEAQSYQRAKRVAGRLQASGCRQPFAFRLTPRDGEARSAVPADDRQLGDYFRTHHLGISSSLVSLPTRNRPAGLGRSTQRTGLLTSGLEAEDRAPAGYVTRMAQRAGVDLAGYRCGLAAHGRYSSRKVLLYLFAPGADLPTLIVKTTRAPEFNDRLRNEAEALVDIHRRGLVAEGEAPRVLFSGIEGGFLMVAESFIEGTGMRRVLARSGGAGWIDAGYEWITRLAERSAERDSPHQGDLSAAVEQIIRMADSVYALDADDRRALTRAAAGLADPSLSLPTVYLHGDAGVWNAVVTPAGQVAFLDWEAADPRGVALWDLFSFARSAALTGKRRRRLAAQPVQLLRALGEDRVLARAVGDYCARAGVSDEAVPALFQICWLHRAVKEAARLSPSRLEGGRYINLVRAMLRSRGGAWWFA